MITIELEALAKEKSNLEIELQQAKESKEVHDGDKGDEKSQADKESLDKENNMLIETVNQLNR